MKTDLTNLAHLRQTALEAKGLAAEVAAAAAEAIEEVVAGQPVGRSITLVAAAWAGSGPYTQTVTAAGVRADEAGQLVQVMPAAASMDAWEAAWVRCTAQGAGLLGFEAKEKPGADIPIFVILQEVQG